MTPAQSKQYPLARLAAVSAAFAWLVVPLQFHLVNHLEFSPLLFLWLAVGTTYLAASAGAALGWILARLRSPIPGFMLAALALLAPPALVLNFFVLAIYRNGTFERRAEVIAEPTLQAYLIAGMGFVLALFLARRRRPSVSIAAGLLATFLVTGILARDAEVERAEKNDVIHSLGKDEPTAARLLVFACDGLDWGVIYELAGKGEMPVFKALIERGAVAHYQTMMPTLSPIIWTTMATGTSWEQHRVHDFIYYDLPGSCCNATAAGTFLSKLILRFSRKSPLVRNYIRLAGSVHRRRLAFWQVLDLAGEDCVTVNWWATFPPADTGGRIVSDVAVETAMKMAIERDANPDLAKKRKIQEAMDKFLRGQADAEGVVSGGAVNDSELADRIIKALDPVKMESYFAAVRRQLINVDFGLSTGLPRKQEERFIRAFIHGEIVRAELARGKEEVYVFYDRLTDQVSHLFWQFYRPDEAVYGENGPSPEAVAGLRDLVPAAYRSVDVILGRLLQSAGPDTDVMVVSDHGFSAIRPAQRFQFGKSDANPARSGHHHHAEPGVFLLAGPKVCVAKPLQEVSIFDFAPTLLYMRGVPVAQNLPGRVVLEAFCEDWPREHPVRRIPTYEYPDWLEGLEAMQADASHLRSLSELGYIGGDDD